MLQLDYRDRIEKISLSRRIYLLILMFSSSLLSFLLCYTETCYFHMEEVKMCGPSSASLFLQRGRIGKK